MSQYTPKKPGDGFYWLVSIGLMFAFPPAGLAMILLKVLGGKDTKRGRHPYYTQRDPQMPVGARTTGTFTPSATPGQSPKGEADALSQLSAKSRRLSIIGGAVAGISLFILLASLGDVAYWLFNGNAALFIDELMDLLLFVCSGIAGGACLWAGWRKKRKIKLWRNYLAMIGRRSSISISSLASASNQTAQKVREDLEDMLDEGVFPSGFLDYGGDMLILSGDGLKDSAPAPTRVAPETEHEKENAILDEIRLVNDAVKNEKLSAQIDRIGVITAKILDYQKQHPEKSPQLHSFLSYYLPTTLKILRAYGQLESQQVSGENIDTAMSRIEGMMDKVVEGFEKQLDQLFQGDAMDIATDVEVLERMLAKDGLSSSQGMTLGL